MKNWYAITGINGALHMHWLYDTESNYKVEINEKGQRYSLVTATATEALKLRLQLRELSKKFNCKLKLTRMSAM